MKSRTPQDQRVNLVLESLSEGDPRLPKPRGKLGKRPKESAFERSKLEATKANGGLVPEYHEPQHWACADCGQIFINRDAAFHCHKLGANRIQVCPRCHRRLADCECPPLTPRITPKADTDSGPRSWAVGRQFDEENDPTNY
jgi:hypothetical protein